MGETGLDKIIEVSKSFNLQDLLAFIAVTKLTKEAYSYAKNRVKELLDKREYGICPTPKEAERIKDISKSDIYHRLKDCVGKNHWSLPIIKIGLYINELDKKGRSDIIRRNKTDILNRYGQRGIKVMHLGDTGMIRVYISYISTLKLERNLSVSESGKILDEIIDTWDKITVFVKSDQTQKEVSAEICKRLSGRHDLFFVFSSGSANEISTKTIAKLSTTGEIRKKDYTFTSHSYLSEDGTQQSYMWVFEFLPNISIKR